MQLACDKPTDNERIQRACYAPSYCFGQAAFTVFSHSSPRAFISARILVAETSVMLSSNVSSPEV